MDLQTKKKVCMYEKIVFWLVKRTSALFPPDSNLQDSKLTGSPGAYKKTTVGGTTRIGEGATPACSSRGNVYSCMDDLCWIRGRSS